MKLRRLSRVCVTAALLLWGGAAHAQTYRETPGIEAVPFTERAEPGASCPACQVLVLQDAYPSPEHVNVYGPPVARAIKATSDLLIYDASSGQGLLVISTPFGAQPPYAAMGLYERVSWVQLRPGMTWVPGDLDGDGRTDLIGHDKRTGEVVRLYRRGH